MIISDSRVSGVSGKYGKIIEPENTSFVGNAKEKVKQKLVEDAQYLLEKKKRQEDKKEKVRRMEENLQKQREMKIRALSEKQSKSEVLREKNKEQQSRKFKQKSDQFKKIIDKIEHHNVQEIQKAFTLQKQLETDRHTEGFSKTSKDNLTKNQRSHSVQTRSEDIDEKIMKIMGKANKAQQQHEEQKKILVDRIKEKTRVIDETRKRAHSYSVMEESEILKNYYQKSEELQKVAENFKTQNEKRLLQKRKSVKEKLDKCSQNLSRLSHLQQQKYQELQIKLSKKVQPKQWKDLRLEKYKQKWQQNARRIELQKQHKAEQILQKHQQITQQHKVYKQQKDKLIQAVKHSNN